MYIVIFDFKLNFDEQGFPHIESDLQNQMNFSFKRFLLLWIENYIERGSKFPRISEICFTTVSSKRYMVNESDIRRPMQMCGVNFNMAVDESLYLINALDRSVNHRLVIK